MKLANKHVLFLFLAVASPASAGGGMWEKIVEKLYGTEAPADAIVLPPNAPARETETEAGANSVQEAPSKRLRVYEREEDLLAVIRERRQSALPIEGSTP